MNWGMSRMESNKAPRARDSRLRQVTARDRGARGLQGKRSASLGKRTAEESCHLGAFSSQVAWPS